MVCLSYWGNLGVSTGLCARATGQWDWNTPRRGSVLQECAREAGLVSEQCSDTVGLKDLKARGIQELSPIQWMGDYPVLLSGL